MSESIKVVIRCRPLSKREIERNCKLCVRFSGDNSVTINNPSSIQESKDFSFDNVFGPGTPQLDIFNKAAKEVLDSLLEGYNGTIFAYGQTGSGKTFTMQGSSVEGENAGIIPASFKYIFDQISSKNERKYMVSVSYYELYNEEIRDLLDTKCSNLELKEHPDQGFYVKDLSTHEVKHWKDMETFMVSGNRNRSVGATLMNEQSSRSHSIFTITVESCSDANIVAGKLHLVDLAGSERQGKTGATGDRLKEATKINLSLSALGNCISALVEKKSHIPYRDSKLTKLLQDSLGGNAKTMMIATFSPADYNFEETMSTLRYANRAKNIKNKPKINMDPKDAKIKEYQDEINRLKALLQARSPTRTSNKNVENYSQLNPSVPVISTPVGLNRDSSQMKIALQKDLQSQQDELEKERKKRDELQRRIASIESKVISGGIPLEERVNMQEKALINMKNELDTKVTQEKELMRLMEDRHNENAQLEEKFVSLQDEIDTKTRKLQKLWDKFQELKLIRDNLSSEFTDERIQLQDTIRDLNREISLKERLISMFVPTKYEADFYSHATYEDEQERWIYTHVLNSSPRCTEDDRIIPTLKQYMGTFLKMTIYHSASVLCKSQKRISTGDSAIDLFLGGGILTGMITEVCGESGTGKTQFSLQCAISCAQIHGFKSVYICTENRFPVTRLHQMILARNEGPMVTEISDTIFVAEAFDLESQSRLLKYHLPRLLENEPMINLVIIDSIAGNFRYGDEELNPETFIDDFADAGLVNNHYSHYNPRRKAMCLHDLATHLKKMAFKHETAFLLINQMTSLPQDDTIMTPKTSIKPALGHTWTSMVNNRLEFKNTGKSKCICITMSPILNVNKTPLYYSISDGGICPVIHD